MLIVFLNFLTLFIALNHRTSELIPDKVYMYEEMMTNDDKGSSLLTSSSLKVCSLYKFCYKLHMSSWRSRWTELYSSYIYEEVKCVGDLPLFILLEPIVKELIHMFAQEIYSTRYYQTA